MMFFRIVGHVNIRTIDIDAGGHEAPPLQVIVTSPTSVGVPLVGTLAISPASQREKQAIGGYKIVKELGAGG